MPRRGASARVPDVPSPGVAFTFVQISDTHLVRDPAARVHGVCPYARLEAAVEHVASLAPAPAFALFTGDLIHDDDPASYEHVRALADRLPIPVRYCVGNHDLRAPFRAQLVGEPGDGPLDYTFTHAGTRFVVLDSSVPGEVEGALDDAQLAWLERALAPAAPTVVVLHHPPVPFGVAWLDEHAVASGAALLDVLTRAGCVRQVLFGHVHLDVSFTRDDLVLRGCPSTAWRFGDGVHVPQVSPGEGAYRVVHVHDDGAIASWTHPLPARAS